MVSYVYAIALKRMNRTEEALREYPRQRNFMGQWSRIF